IVLALAWAYVTYGTLPQVSWLFYGIKPVVVAIIAQALWGLCRTVLKGVWPVVVAALVLVLYLLGVNVLLLLFGGGLLFGLIQGIERWWRNQPNQVNLILPLTIGHLGARWRTMTASVFGAVTAAPAIPFSLLTL